MGPEVLHDVSFRLDPGGFRYLLGPNGAGKTSLMRLLYLAHQPSRGVASVFGSNISQLDSAERTVMRRRIGVIFQDLKLLDHLSALDNVALPLRVAGGVEADVRRHVSELLSWVGLADQLHACPPALSGGQRQRVAIARAVITRPKLLLADEPTGNLDDDLGGRLLYLFEELSRIGTTIIVATHNERLIEHSPHPVWRLTRGVLDAPGDE